MCNTLPTTPAPYSSSSHLCDLHQEQHDLSHQYPLQHHPDCFDSSIDISYRTTCMHFSCLSRDGEHVSTNNSHKNTQKKTAYLTWSCDMSSMSNNHVYFMFHEFIGCTIQLCLSPHISLSMWRYPSERKGWEASCCFFEVTGKEGTDVLEVSKGNERQERRS